MELYNGLTDTTLTEQIAMKPLRFLRTQKPNPISKRPRRFPPLCWTMPRTTPRPQPRRLPRSLRRLPPGGDPSQPPRS